MLTIPERIAIRSVLRLGNDAPIPCCIMSRLNEETKDQIKRAIILLDNWDMDSNEVMEVPFKWLR